MMMTVIIIWSICITINVLLMIIETIIVEKKFEATFGEILLMLFFFVIAAPFGTLIALIAIFDKFGGKTIINWTRKSK